MGMTIDEVIKELEWALANNTIEDVESAFKYISAIHMAIDIMRKYQKIKEIIADWKSDGGAFEMSEPYWLRLISEEVEDGNDR